MEYSCRQAPNPWVACCHCERCGRLQVDRLIEQHGIDMGLPELGNALAGGCPKAAAVSISERCDVFFFPKLGA